MSEQKNKIYVGNLAYSVTDEELNNFFEEKGLAVQSVTIIKDKYTDRSKGFGFVEVDSEETVQKAIELLNGQEMKGRALTVSQAREREPRRDRNFSRGNRGDRGFNKGNE